MTLRVSGKNLDIGDALRDHIADRIDSILMKYRAGSAAGHVTIEREGSAFRSDCTLHLKPGATLQADSRAHEPYSSFNRAADLIENQVRRHRERLMDHHASSAGGTLRAENAMRENELGGVRGEPPAEQGETRELHPAVIAEPSPQFRAMTVSGAAMELDSTNAQVIVFRHASDGRTNVVYRRPDGNIGWIDPGKE
ncbi:MAG: ribosome-associated translation inhibitor RaiA [Beijerinckiaceae bacterium]|nr:ribosome-associated translation inhibitor RaiA [Beijerinckiaceae bacterium]MCI0735738.1 ribosome-associated translation inhibitor RaiA [Beijerinckiaceae bacterium]